MGLIFGVCMGLLTLVGVWSVVRADRRDEQAFRESRETSRPPRPEIHLSNGCVRRLADADADSIRRETGRKPSEL
jgi:hypothetical protein